MELRGIQIELDTASIAVNCGAETEESNIKGGDILQYTDSGAFKKDLCTKSTDDDILTKCEDVIQSREFQEPDEKKLSKPKTGTDFQEFDMVKEPAVNENIVSGGIEYESTKSSYDDKRLADGITIAQATSLQYPTSVQTTRPKNKNKTLLLQHVYQVPTCGIYAKGCSLNRDLTIA